MSTTMSDQGMLNGGQQTTQVNGHTDTEFDAIVIGAGFGGLRLLYELRKQGLRGRVFESGSGVGGVRVSPSHNQRSCLKLQTSSATVIASLTS